MFEAWGHTVYRRRRLVLVIATLGVIFAAVWGTGVFGALQGQESQISSLVTSSATVLGAIATEQQQLAELIGSGRTVAETATIGLTASTGMLRTVLQLWCCALLALPHLQHPATRCRRDRTPLSSQSGSRREVKPLRRP